MNVFEKILQNLNEILLNPDAWHPLGILFTVLFVILSVGLAAGLSSRAERFGSNPTIYLFFGLVIPIIFPLLALLFMFKVRDVSDQSAKDTEEEELEEHADLPPGEEILDKDYFYELSSKHRDTVYYRFSLKDDKTLTIYQIVECLPEVLVVIILDEENEKHRMRVPYSKVDSVEVIKKY